MLNELPPGLEERFPEYVEKWTKVGLSCEPANWTKAWRAVRCLYRHCKLAPPRSITLAASPLATCLAGPITSAVLGGNNVAASVAANVRANVVADVAANVWANVRDNVWDNVGANVRANVRDNVWDNVRDNVGDNVLAKVWANVEANVEANVGDNVGANVRANVWANVRDNVRDNVWANVRDNVWDNVGDNVLAKVWANVEANVGDNVLAKVWANVEANVEANVGDNVGANVRANVWANVRDNVRDNVRANVLANWHKYRGGNLWAHWFAYLEVIQAAGFQPAALRGLKADRRLAESAGWYWPHAQFCIVTDRPRHLRFDDAGRLHCETGQAAEWRDGWGFYMIHGVRADRQIVLAAETQTVEQLRNEDNEEVRRIRIERYGWRRYLETVSARLIDTRRNDIEATDEALLATDRERVLVCACPSTARVYALEVPPEVETCEAAQQWLWGDSGIRTIGRT